jgi:ATP diphosphatase
LIDPARVADELGDLLFSLAQLARKLDIDPEAALRAANRKFRRRFDALEDGVREEGLDLASLGLAALEARWQVVKAAERA